MATTTTPPAPPSAVLVAGLRPWLGWFALSVIIGMQAGTVFRPLGSAGDTRVADWVDLLTPSAVLGPSAGALARAKRRDPVGRSSTPACRTG